MRLQVDRVLLGWVQQGAVRWRLEIQFNDIGVSSAAPSSPADLNSAQTPQSQIHDQSENHQEWTSVRGVLRCGGCTCAIVGTAQVHTGAFDVRAEAVPMPHRPSGDVLRYIVEAPTPSLAGSESADVDDGMIHGTWRYEQHPRYYGVFLLDKWTDASAQVCLDPADAAALLATQPLQLQTAVYSGVLHQENFSYQETFILSKVTAISGSVSSFAIEGQVDCINEHGSHGRALFRGTADATAGTFAFTSNAILTKGIALANYEGKVVTTAGGGQTLIGTFKVIRSSLAVTGSQSQEKETVGSFEVKLHMDTISVLTPPAQLCEKVGPLWEVNTTPCLQQQCPIEAGQCFGGYIQTGHGVLEPAILYCISVTSARVAAETSHASPANIQGSLIWLNAQSNSISAMEGQWSPQCGVSWTAIAGPLFRGTTLTFTWVPALVADDRTEVEARSTLSWALHGSPCYRLEILALKTPTTARQVMSGTYQHTDALTKSPALMHRPPSEQQICLYSFGCRSLWPSDLHSPSTLCELDQHGMREGFGVYSGSFDGQGEFRRDRLVGLKYNHWQLCTSMIMGSLAGQLRLRPTSTLSTLIAVLDPTDIHSLKPHVDVGEFDEAVVKDWTPISPVLAQTFVRLKWPDKRNRCYIGWGDMRSVLNLSTVIVLPVRSALSPMFAQHAKGSLLDEDLLSALHNNSGKMLYIDVDQSVIYRNGDGGLWQGRLSSDKTEVVFTEFRVNEKRCSVISAIEQKLTEMLAFLREDILQADDMLREFDARAATSPLMQEFTQQRNTTAALQAGHLRRCNVDGGSEQDSLTGFLYCGPVGALRGKSHGFATKSVVTRKKFTSSTVTSEHRGGLAHGFGSVFVSSRENSTFSVGNLKFGTLDGVNAHWDWRSPSRSLTTFQFALFKDHTACYGPRHIVYHGLPKSCAHVLGHANGPHHDGVFLSRRPNTASVGLVGSVTLDLWWEKQLSIHCQSDDIRVARVMAIRDHNNKSSRVHSTHPLVQTLCTAVEFQAVQLDAAVLSWLKDCARSDAEQVSVQAAAGVDNIACTHFLCDGCGARLFLGDHWQCQNFTCFVDMCNACKGGSEWGRTMRQHNELCGPLLEINRNWLESFQARTSATKPALFSASAFGKPATVTAMEMNLADIPAVSTNGLLSAESAKPSIPAPTTLDFSFEGQREAVTLGPTMSMALTAAATRPPTEGSGSSSVRSSLSLQRDAPSKQTMETRVVHAGESSSGATLRSDHDALSESLLTAQERSVCNDDSDLPHYSALPPTSNSTSSSIPSHMTTAPSHRAASPSANLLPLPAVLSATTLLVELDLTLQQSVELLSLTSDAVLDAAIPSHTEGVPTHLGTPWLRSLIKQPLSSYLKLSTPDDTARQQMHKLLLSRVRSLLPLLRWIHRRAVLEVSGTLDASCPPLRQDQQQRVALHVLLRHYVGLLELVRVELHVAPFTRPSESRAQKFAKWLRTGVESVERVVAKAATAPGRVTERAETCTTPAFALWVRLQDTADLMLACIPFRTTENTSSCL